MGFGLGSILGLLKGRPAQEVKTPMYTPEQEGILNQLMQQGAKGFDFSGVEGLAQKRFQEETIPSIAERFTGMGSGSQRSSAFQSSLGRAGGDLEAQLAALRPQMAGQQLGFGMQPRFQTSFTQGQPGALAGLAQSLPQILALLGGLF